MSDSDTGSRRDFLHDRRRAARAAFDTSAPRYDATWATTGTAHLTAIARLVEHVPPGGSILDAACGTGRYWEAIEARGSSVFAIDQSPGMLAVARAKRPDVGQRELSLQELRDAADLHGRFDGLTCIDAMEWVGPEDWPVVLEGFRRVLRPGCWAYLAIEIPEDGDLDLMARSVAAEQVPGEIVGDSGFYAYFPAADTVAAWLSNAGFVVRSELVGDGYRHVILQSTRE